MDYLQIETLQKEICSQNQCGYVASPEKAISGFATSTSGMTPINGLRHPIASGASGWYIWCGQWSEQRDFFQPMHTRHLYDQYPEVASLLGLPPGYRFLRAGEYLDVWFDETLLSV